MYGNAGVAVTIAQVRAQIADQPVTCAPPGRYELIAAPTDGVQAVYPLAFSKARLDTLSLFLQGTSANAAPPPWTAVPSNDPYNAWVAETDASGMPHVRFLAAPAAGQVFGVRYTATIFSDSELQTYMGPENLKSTTTLTLAAIHLAIIPALLGNREAHMLQTINGRTDNPANWSANLRKLADHLATRLDGDGDSDVFGAGVSGYWPGGYVR